MADEKKGTGPERPVVPESPAPESPGGPPVPEQAAEQGVIPGMGDGPAQPEPGDVVVDFEKINELMAEKRAAARDAVEHEEAPAPEAETPADGPSVPKPPDKGAAPDDREPWEKTSAELEAEQKKPRRGRPPKEEKAEQGASDTAKPRKGRPAKADKAAPGEAPPSQRDKVSRGKKAAPVKAEPKAPAPEPAREEPKAPPRPVEDQKIVYLKLSELHAFHTFRAHPFQVKDDDRMTELARKWNVDYAFYKTGPDKYLLFFKSGQADAITACFSEYSRRVLEKSKSSRVPIREQLKRAADALSRQPSRKKERAKEAAHEDR